MSALSMAMEEALAVFEAYRRLGFPPDEIFCLHDAGRIYMGINHQGKRFAVVVGETEGAPAEDVQTAWLIASMMWNSAEMPEAERQRIWSESNVSKNGGLLVQQLIVKAGIFPPGPSTEDVR